MNKDLYDTIIIGNGILAYSLAYQLRKREKDMKIVVVGPPKRPGGATVTAGAMINVWSELAYRQFDNPALAERAELPIRALGAWDGLCEELSEFSQEPLTVKWGTYLINNAYGSPHERRTVDFICEVMQERGVEFRSLAQEEVSWLNPEGRGEVSRVTWLPDGRIDPRKVLEAYERSFEARRVDRIDGEAVRFDAGKSGLLSGRREKSVTLSDGTVLRGPCVVLANGTYAQELIDQVPELRKETPRLLWGAGSALDIDLPPWVHQHGGIDRSIFDIDAVIRTVDRGGACGLHLVPYGNGEYYCGASSGVWFEPEKRPRLHAVHVLLRGLVEEINRAFFFATLAVRGPGFRPVTIDTFPLLGESHMKGIWFANGTKRDGFTCSPVIAKELASGIVGGKIDLPRRFRPSRPLISYKNREQAIEDAVTASLGGEIQHGLYVPPYARQKYEESKRGVVEKAYAQRGITDFGIHPEVVHLYENDDFFAAIDHRRESVK